MWNLLWRDGRLSWPFVIGVMFVTLTLVLFDLAWRLLTIDFEKFALAGFLLAGSVILAMAVAFRALGRSQARPVSPARHLLE